MYESNLFRLRVHLAEHFADFISEVNEWILEGRIVYKEDIRVGLESAPDAFVGMLQGRKLWEMCCQDC